MAAFWLTVAVLLCLSACGGGANPLDSAAKSTGEPSSAAPIMVIQGLRAREYVGDDLQCVIDGSHATIDKETKDVKVYDVTAVFAKSNGTTGTLTGQEATIYTVDRVDDGIAQNDILLEGDVRLCDNSMKLRAPSVRYFSKGTDVVFRSGGDGFVADTMTSTGRIHSTGSYFEANNATPINIRGFGPGTLSSSASGTSATTPAANEWAEPLGGKPVAAATPQASPKPPQPSTRAKTAAAPKKPVRKPAQTK